MQQVRYLFRSLGVIALLVSLALVGVVDSPARVAAQEPSLTLTPDHVSCTTTVTARGAGFVPNSDVVLSPGGVDDIPSSINEPSVGPVTVGSDGTFAIEFAPGRWVDECTGGPLGPGDGPFQVTASTIDADSPVGASGPPTATATFTFALAPDDPQLTLEPNSGSGCIEVVARGENFTPNTIVTIISDAQPVGDLRVTLGEVTVASDGSFAFTLPQGRTPFIACEGDGAALAGSYTVTASTGQLKVGDGLTEPFAGAEFRVDLTAAEHFERTWARTDRPVETDQVDRTWMWGPEPVTEVITEQYLDSPGDTRQVQYFDKSRMEINCPVAECPERDPNSLWYVTNGLLVIEMVEGRYQIGDAQFDESPEPADIPIVGDPDSGAPTYADIDRLSLRDQIARDEGEIIDDTFFDQNDFPPISLDRYAAYGVTAAHRVDYGAPDHIDHRSDHTVASVFWDFMTSNGLVYDVSTGQYVEGPLFQNPFYATGYPITEAWWTTALLQGEPTDILWQCFERRCLTYTPSNPEGFKVEAGNVGQHYYQWRYGSLP